jgi:dTDP-4-dehydrorhamnose 3,5-epimerase
VSTIERVPPLRDIQTVEPSGRRLDRLPDGMVVRDLVTHTDERGTVCELYDPRWGVTPDEMVFAYQFTIRPGMAKGWGMHREHEDRYAFLDGELELAFYDARESSPTFGEQSRLFLSQLHRRLLVIPRGVWHAERNAGQCDVRVVNFPTIPYDHANPDKYRLPLDTDELPVRLGPGWQGS